MKLLLSVLPVRLQVRAREIVLFVIVGLLNTAIDFMVLNLLILLLHHDSGIWLIGFSCISFLAAVVNSYVLNGRLTFRGQTSRTSSHFIRFVAVNAVGLVINSTIVWSLVEISGHRFPVMVIINVGKAMAVFGSLTWNYVATKRWVFNASSAHPAYNAASFPTALVSALKTERSRKNQLSHPSLWYDRKPVLKRVILLPIKER